MASGQLYSVKSLLLLLIIDANAQLSIFNDCVCPGYDVTFECTVFGGGFTVWRGSAFNCPLSLNEILLPHSNFEDGTVRTCNNRAIAGHSVRVMDSFYTSQLVVSFTSGLDGTTIECTHEDGSTTAMVIGSSMLLTTTDPLPSPSDVGLSYANTNLLTFKWSSVATNCSAVNYIINSDCGICPSSTNLTSANCYIDKIRQNLMTTSWSMICQFSVKSIVCGNIEGNSSNIVYADLKVPESPNITSITAIYNNDAQKRLLSVKIIFSEVEPFMISDGIDGSPLYYTILYSDAGQSNTMCGSDSILSPCQQSICSSSLPPSCYSASGSINVTIFASNRLGNGTATSLSIGTMDQYVDVNFESASTVICKFLNQQDEYRNRSCTITLRQCISESMSVQGHTTSSSVRLEFSSSFCYTINASNETFTVLIEGMYNNDNEDRILAISLTAAFTGLFYIAMVVICVLLYRRWRRRMVTNHLPSSSETRLNLRSLTCPDESDPILMEFKPTLSRNEPITVHVIFDAADKPWTLMRILKSLKNINIIDIMISPLMITRSRKIYLQCESPLTDDQQENIRNTHHGDNHIINIEFPAGQLIQSRDVYGNEPEPFIGYRYTQCLPPSPGSLYNLLKNIHDVSRKKKCYQWINITNIIFRQSEAYPGSTVVEISFVCELPKNWKKEFGGDFNFNHSVYNMQEVSTNM